ncbi:glycoside hydrolase N-terminal domain-containing protein [Planctomycetota bacterium]
MKQKESAILFSLMLLTLSARGAGAGYILSYDSPASSNLPVHIWGAGDNPPSSPGARSCDQGNYLREALLLGNGRLGAMFNGAIDTEHLMMNESSAWMNTSRGRDEVAQSGVRLGSHRYLDTLREATRNEQYGRDENSIETLCTKYFGSHTRLGNYAPFTDVFITTGHDPAQVKDYQRSLNLRTGVGKVRYRIGDTNYTREYFCSYPHDLMVVRYTSDGEPLNLKIQTSTQHKTKLHHGYVNRIMLAGETTMVRDNIEFMQIIHVLKKDNQYGIGATPSGVISVRNGNDVTIYIAGYTDYLPSYPTFKGRDYEVDCQKTVSEAVNAGYAAMKKAHIDDVTKLIDRCQLALDFQASGVTTDKLIAAGNSLELQNLYFDFARYLQLACSRGTAIPSNLQGIWNSSLAPSWNCDYHNDINIAMNYWMVETANLVECFGPYAGWMKVIAESGVHTAKEAYGAQRGWSAGLNGNIFGFTATNEHGRRMQHSGAWLAQNLYDHFSFSRDETLLEDIYPICKGAAEFFLEFLAPWKDGSLVVYPTWSPENVFLREQYGGENMLAYGASYDQQLIYALFVDCIEASVLLGIDEEFREELKATIPKLCPQKIGQHGQLQEWPSDVDRANDTHRHVSHLIALHPGRDISLLTNKELAEAAQVTLNARSGGSGGRGGGGWRGAWRASLWARLQDGERAYKYIVPTGSPNLFNGQIDANFGVPAGVCEMLLQSHLRSIDNRAERIGDAAFVAYKKDKAVSNHFLPVVPDDTLANAPYIIHLLPALPSAWPKGSVKGLRARGGFEVDIEWKDGKLVQAKIHAKRDGAFRIYDQGKLSKVISLKQGQSMVWPGMN